MLTPQTPGHGKSLKRNSKHIREQAGGESGDDITNVLNRHVHGHSSGVRGRSRLGAGWEVSLGVAEAEGEASILVPFTGASVPHLSS